MISVRLNGRLGNQMFQYATVRAIAHKNSYDFFIPRIGHEQVSESTEGHHLSAYFNLPLGVDESIYGYRYDESAPSQEFKPFLFNLKDFTLISGFFQTEKYFMDIEDQVNDWFRLEFDAEISRFFDDYNVDKTCFIHIRGTDYKHHNHWMLSQTYYQSAITKMREMIPDIRFLVITDDIETSTMMLPDIKAITNDMMFDFKILYFSRYCIISNSTFAWWGGWLNSKEKTIVAPNFWLNFNKPELNFYPQDIKSSKFIYV